MRALQIVRFECGCIGTAPDEKDESAILHACDGDGGVGPRCRPMGDKAYEPIDANFGEVVWQAFADAERGCELRKALSAFLV
jgi:hypothetical protein